MRSELLQLYDYELRSNPPQQIGVRYEFAEGVLRARGPANWVFTRDLNPADLDLIVSREANLFRSLGEDVEWKIYGHEPCEDLPMRLAAHGFEAAETETLMFLDLARWRHETAAPPGIQIRRVSDSQGLLDHIAVMVEAFGHVRPEMLQELQRTCLAPDPIVFAYTACADEAPIAAGRMESSPGYAFASIWGGCTVPAFRHQGIFRALVSTRVDFARRRGHSYMAVDAADTSKPILERLGFWPMTTVTGWNLRAEKMK